MTKTIYIFGLCLVLFSCGDFEKRLVFDKEMIEYFDDSLTKHFPSKVPRIYQTSISHDLSNSHPHVRLKFEANKEKYDSIKNSVEKIAVARYKSEDSCLLVLDKHLNENNWRKIDKKLLKPRKIEYKNYECHEGKYPVPNFFERGWGDSSNSMTRLEDYIIYVLESKSGKFMDSTKIPNGLYTPKGWEHGYSKGLALKNTDRTVIYWLEIW